MNNSTEEKLADNPKTVQAEINIYIHAFSRRFYPERLAIEE